jgi:hypothetical protein
MAIAASDVAESMAYPDFDSASTPTETEVNDIIARVTALVSSVEIPLTTDQRDDLILLRTLARVVRMRGLFPVADAVALAESYITEYNDTLDDLRERAQYDSAGTGATGAYGLVRKVNR